MGLADVHAHLTHPLISPYQSEILDRAHKAGVTTVISNGLNPGDNESIRELSIRHPIVKPAFGFYPVDTVLPEMRKLNVPYHHEREECDAETGLAWLKDNLDLAFAVGEIGLDGHWVPQTLWQQQEEVFCRIVEMALTADKPMIVHTRKREKRALELLTEQEATRVVWHCFGGKIKLLKEIAERGHYFSIPANARRSEGFTKMLEILPRELVLLETDSPYLSPDKEKMNEPANIALTCVYAAEIWQLTVSEVREQLAENFTRLFGVEP